MSRMRPSLVAVLAVLASLSATAQQPASPAPTAADIAPCIAQLRAEAVKRGVDGHAFDGWFEGVEPDNSAIELMDRQPEFTRSEEHTSELQSRLHLVCRLLLEKKKKKQQARPRTNQ